jgi:Uncharacterized protein conserved in bacteria
MDPSLKQRLTGAAVLVILAVIFIPMLLDNSEEQDQVITATNIPPQPEDMPLVPPAADFSSRVIPLQPQETGQSLPPETEGPSEPVAGGTEAAGIAPTEQEPQLAAMDKEDTVNLNHAGQVGLTAWVVQLGSFSSEENAQALNQKLRAADFKAFVEPLQQKNVVVYRVRIGPELKHSDAEAINQRLKEKMQMEGIIVHYP